MNLESRLRKAESSVGSISEFCVCESSRPGSSNLVVIEPEWELSDEEAEVLQNERIAEAQKPIYCDGCGKQIERRLIIIRGFDSDIPVPHGGLDRRAYAN